MAATDEVISPPTVAKLLDRANAIHGVTDWKLSALLGVVPSAVKNYRAGRSLPDDDVAARLAKLAEYDPGFVVASVHAQRAGTKDARKLWSEIAARLSTKGNALAVTAILAAGMMGFDGGPDGGAMAAALPSLDSAGVLYLMSTVAPTLLLALMLALRARRSPLWSDSALSPT